ncbi:hypothetical protein E2L07_16490 [Halalkalibacterium halodurans]|uniref:hypothetical protein n=1 Tax=Halalkalibacterium halodurans TaxID=86665 RepID=UPI0010672761|nr:hypothetical protein [Halalkalibacterium halodurans]TES50211.1 hypothetical protein E2L07_16490 [Halalkalibacterium halodurans]
MLKKPLLLFVIVSAFAAGLYFSFFSKQPSLHDALTFFPIDPDAAYTEATTSIELMTKKDEDEYTLDWATASTLDQPAFLRQDVSLLFEDGYLIDTLYASTENEASLTMNKKVAGEDSGHYVAVTFHHSEIHYPNDDIMSAQTISRDELYIIDSPLSPLLSFKVAKTAEEKEGKRILDTILKQQMTYIQERLIEHFAINSESYYVIPLTKLADYQSVPLPNLDVKQTAIILSGLWERLYKHYVLSSGNAQHSTNPIGSTIPLIFLSENGDHAMIIYETDEGKPVQLLQTFSFS